jgi:AraC-like DNA-binding protein
MAIGPLYRCFLEIARERGVDLAEVMREARIERAELLDPSTRLSPERGVALGKALFRRVQYPEIGLEAASRMQLSDLDLLGYVMKHARDLAAALSALARYGRLIGDTAAFSVEYGESTVVVGIARTGGRKALPPAGDFAVAVLARLVRELTVDEVMPCQVHLPRVEPRDASEYTRTFATTIVFGAERGALVYPSSALLSPMRHSDPELVRILSRQADAELASLPPDAHIVARVRAQLARELEQGSSDLAAVARTLGVSERTLRRRLSDAATGFRELLDDVRRERALTLADEGVQSVTTIGIMAGFGDGAAFARAFRRWTGRSPSDYLLERTQATAPTLDAGRAGALDEESR